MEPLGDEQMTENVAKHNPESPNGEMSTDAESSEKKNVSLNPSNIKEKENKKNETAKCQYTLLWIKVIDSSNYGRLQCSMLYSYAYVVNKECSSLISGCTQKNYRRKLIVRKKVIYECA